MRAATPQRVGLVVHPTRPVSDARATLERWAGEHGVELLGDDFAAEHSDLIVALGGDGTVLAALRRAMPAGVPVLGVACGSLGALSAVSADELDTALRRFDAGDWRPRRLPALFAVATDGTSAWAVNDVVIDRRGSGQVAVDVTVDGELYARLAGDGLIVATAAGSSAYSMAAGGPLLAGGTQAFVCTPLAAHGGSTPPLVVPAAAAVSIEVHPGFAGFDVEIDGRRMELPGTRFGVALHPDKVTLVEFGPPSHGLEGLRRRGLVTDSPRVLARDDRLRRGT